MEFVESPRFLSKESDPWPMITHSFQTLQFDHTSYEPNPWIYTMIFMKKRIIRRPRCFCQDGFQIVFQAQDRFNSLTVSLFSSCWCSGEMKIGAIKMKIVGKKFYTTFYLNFLSHDPTLPIQPPDGIKSDLFRFIMQVLLIIKFPRVYFM